MSDINQFLVSLLEPSVKTNQPIQQLEWFNWISQKISWTYRSPSASISNRFPSFFPVSFINLLTKTPVWPCYLRGYTPSTAYFTFNLTMEMKITKEAKISNELKATRPLMALFGHIVYFNSFLCPSGKCMFYVQNALAARTDIHVFVSKIYRKTSFYDVCCCCCSAKKAWKIFSFYNGVIGENILSICYAAVKPVYVCVGII